MALKQVARYQTTVTAIETVDNKTGQPHARPILVTSVIAAISQYPGRYSVEPAMLRGIKPGDQVWLTMRKGKQRPDTDGSRPWHWYYEVESVGLVQAALDAAPDSAKDSVADTEEVAPPARQGAGLRMDRDTSIMREVAVKEAVTLVTECYRAWAALNGAKQPLPEYLNSHLPPLLAQTRKAALELYKSIKGRDGTVES